MSANPKRASDRELANLRSGDQRVRFEALFEDNSRAVLGYALRRARRPEDAADVLSEVMLTAWRRIEDAPDGPEARFWLFGIARNVLMHTSRSSDDCDSASGSDLQ